MNMLDLNDFRKITGVVGILNSHFGNLINTGNWEFSVYFLLGTVPF
jgi:hypothetical protein